MARAVSTPSHASTRTPLEEGVALFGECGDLDGQPMSAEVRTIRTGQESDGGVHRRCTAIYKIYQNCGWLYSQPLTISMIIFDAAVRLAVVDFDTDHAALASVGRQATTTKLCSVRTHDLC